MVWLGITALLLVAIVVRALRRRRRPVEPEARFRVEFDETELAVVCPDTGRRTLAWSELTRVGIRASPNSVGAAELFWGLHDESGRAKLVFPGGAVGEGALLRELSRRLPGLRQEALVRAMASTVDAGFVLWERAEEDAPPGLLH